MLHLPTLIEDLALILISASLMTLIFKKINQPVVLGYLVAGFLVSPHVSFLPSVKDSENIKVWGEIGVIFLLFSLGLEFSFKKLASVGKAASITALTEVLFMLALGYITGQIFGWGKMDSLFLGGILSISSTTIIVKAFEELKLKQMNFVKLVFGTLVVEDLIAILLLVLLSTIAATQAFSGLDLLISSLKLGFFLILWFVIGLYLLPTLLNKIKSILDEETILVISVGLCLIMVVIATYVGFSPALGAFVMGSLLAETKQQEKIEHLLLPVKNLFASVFFVSVGMLIDPTSLIENWKSILVISFVTIFGKFISSSIGSLIAGKDLKQSVQTGLSLAQIGEFSFIIATLGLTLKVTSPFLYPLAVAVSAVTTFTTPYFIKYSESIYQKIDRLLPANTKIRLQNYEYAVNNRKNSSVLHLIFSTYINKLLINSVLVIAITLLIANYSSNLINKIDYFEDSNNLLAFIINLILATPFLWAILVKNFSKNKNFNFLAIDQIGRIQFGITILRFIIATTLLSFIVSNYFNIFSLVAIVIILISLVSLLFSRLAEPIYHHFEKQLLENLNLKSEFLSSKNDLAPWKAIVAHFVINPNSDIIGKTLEEAKLKENYGVLVTMIKRGDQTIFAPQRSEKLFPYDQIYLLGTDEQLIKVSDFFNTNSKKSITNSTYQEDEFGLDSIILDHNSHYINKTIKDCGVREDTQGIIVGIERNNERILNPVSSLILLEKDLIWLVGNKHKIRSIKIK